MWTFYLFGLLPNGQESQAVPLSNINSVMGEATTGKTTRRLYFQDELPAGTAGTAESPTETGHTLIILNIHCTRTFEIVLHVVLRLIHCWHFTISRWCKGQSFKQLQEAAIHLDAHRLRR